jgi:Tol biopolymer transport system component
LTGSDTQVIASADAFYQTPAFSPDGNYFYFRKAVDKAHNGFNLLRAPALGGTPQMIIQDVDTGISFSPDGKRIAFIRGMDPDIGKFKVLTANADGTDARMLYGGPVSEFPVAVAWSPDGKQVASVVPSAGEALSAIKIKDVFSAQTKSLYQLNVQLSDLSWLPGGNGLLATYQKNATPFARSQIGFVSNTAGEFRPITKDTNSYGSLTLAADGKTLATIQQKTIQTLYLLHPVGFAGDPPNPARAQSKDSPTFHWASNEDLYFGDSGNLLRISVDRGNKSILLSDPSAQIIGAISCASGRYAIVTWAGHLASSKVDLWRVEGDGSNPKQLTQGMVDVLPVCSPDGKWVYYNDLHNLQIKRVSIEGGTPEVAPGTSIAESYANPGLDISRDGKLLTFFVSKTIQNGPLEHAVVLVSLDTGGEPSKRMLDTDPRISGLPRFTPDRKAVIYPIGENGVDNLWLNPLDGSRGRQITNFKSDTINMFEFSPDGKTLGVMRSQIESDVVLMRDTTSSPPL